MEFSKIRAVNRVNISGVDKCDEYVNIMFILCRGGENRDPQKRCAHTHTYFQIHYIVSGSVVYEIDGKLVNADSGKCVVIPPKHSHSVVNQSKDYIKITVSADVESNSDVYSFLIKGDNYLHDITPDMHSGLKFVVAHANRRGMFCETLIKKRLTEMVYILADRASYGKTGERGKGFHDDRLVKAISYIEDNPNIFFKCYEVAQHCGISTKLLGQLFQKYKGESTLDFIHSQKINDACDMLLHTNDASETIALKLGFSSKHYFSKFFVFEMGMPPSEYRKKYSKILSKEGEENEKN